MSVARVYHVLASHKYAADRMLGEITCTPNDWPPYEPGTVVFVFEDKGEALAYAATRDDNPVVLALNVAAASLAPDDSSPRSTVDEFLSRFPEDSDLLGHLAEAVAWKSARVHLGPVPLSVLVEVVAP